MEEVLAVFTFKSKEAILENGGTQSWVLNRNRASKCAYVVMYRNATHVLNEGTEPHGAAFLVGKVSDIVLAKDYKPTDTKKRWLVKISEYADVEAKDMWEGRNPVQYWREDQFKFDFGALEFQPLTEVVKSLTISEAKAALSRSLQVPESAIEITINA